MTHTAKQPRVPRESSYDLDTQRLARVYAKALYQTALERDQVVPIQEELEAFFQEVMPIEPAIASFFNSGALGRERRDEIIQKVMLPHVSELVGNLMMVLNAHERLGIFGAVVASYLALCETSAGKIKVQVRSPVSLTSPQRDSLLQKLRTTLHQEPSLEESVDPTLSSSE